MTACKDVINYCYTTDFASPRIDSTDFMTGPFLLRITFFVFCLFLFVCFFSLLFPVRFLVPCGRLSWLPVGFWAHESSLSYRTYFKFFLLSRMVKEFYKSLSIWWSYGEEHLSDPQQATLRSVRMHPLPVQTTKGRYALPVRTASVYRP